MPPDLTPLLSEAAELAPEWCRRNGDVWFFPDGCYALDSPNQTDRNQILGAVLKECERRGWPVTLEYDPDTKTWTLYKRADRLSWYRFGDKSSDPTESALSFFLAMLRQGKAEVNNVQP